MDATTVLFVCTRNIGPSPMAEAYLNEIGGPHRRAFSAGLSPGARVAPLAIRTLRAAGLPVDGLAPKPVEVFGMPHAPRPDVVVTLSPDGLAAPAVAWWQPARLLSWCIADPGPDGCPDRFAALFEALVGNIDRALVEGCFDVALRATPAR